MSKVTTEGYSDQSNVVLSLTLDNSVPIELGAFVNAFTSLAKDYQSSLESKGLDGDASIYITEVRSGSIVADMMPLVASAFPAIVASATQLAQAVDFVNDWKNRLALLSEGVIPEGMGKNDFKTFSKAVEAIARDPDGSQKLEAATFEDGKRQVRASFSFNSKEAQKISRTIDAELKRLDKETDEIERRVVMYFKRSDVGDAPIEKRSGERVVIPDISPRDLPIVYASKLAEDRIKDEVRKPDENIFNKGFSVDVSVQKRGEKPIVYKIIEVHQVFDLPDDDS